MNEGFAFKITFYIVDDSYDQRSAKSVMSICNDIDTSGFEFVYISNNIKKGRGYAVRQGMASALSNQKHEVIVEMDSDGSHTVTAFKKVIENIGGADLVIGSRYLPLSKIENWPLLRKVFSFWLNRILRIIFKISIFDYTNGLRAYSRQASQIIVSNPQQMTGFIYLTEELLILAKKEIYPIEVPITFINRTKGESTVTLAEIRSSLRGVYKLRKFYT